jgi:hypothetical protein
MELLDEDLRSSLQAEDDRAVVLLALIPVAVALAALQLAVLDPLVVGEFGIVVLHTTNRR